MTGSSSASCCKNSIGNVEIIELTDPGDVEKTLAAGRFDVVLADHRPSWIDAFHLRERIRAAVSRTCR